MKNWMEKQDWPRRPGPKKPLHGGGGGEVDTWPDTRQAIAGRLAVGAIAALRRTSIAMPPQKTASPLVGAMAVPILSQRSALR
jgi:hypothetical protein